MKPRYVTIYKFIFVVQKINENHFGLVIRTKIVLSALSPCDPQNVSDRRTDRLVINTHMAPRVFSHSGFYEHVQYKNFRLLLLPECILTYYQIR